MSSDDLWWSSFDPGDVQTVDAPVVPPGTNASGAGPTPAPGPAPRTSQRARKRLIVGGLVGALLIGALAGAGITRRGAGSKVVSRGTTVTAPFSAGLAPTPTAPAGPLDVKAVLAKVEPAVVSVTATVRGARGFGSGQDAGTGMILTPDGKVLTNAHVVAGGTSIQVSIPGQSSHAAHVLGVDAPDDVAVLQIEGVSNLPTVTIGSSAALQVGDPVVAVGNALGLDGGPTVTTGIVSALNRQIDAENGPLNGLVQTDAPINPGNSGGPLLNAVGQVIGMNTAVAGNAQNIGFAIAVDKITPLLPKLESGESSSAVASTGYLGVATEDANPGAGIVQVASGSPASAAGLRVGDVITSIDGQPVSSASALVDGVRTHKPGDKVTLQVSGRKVTAVLGTRPPSG